MNQTVKELHEERKQLWEASIQNHSKYIDNDNGLFKSNYVELRNCPVCDNNSFINIFNKEGGQYVKCKI